jgi:hypothetical protein
MWFIVGHDVSKVTQATKLLHEVTVNAGKLSIIVGGLLLLPGFAAAQTESGPTPAATPAQQQFKPMTQGERFHHFVASTFNVESVIRAAAGAAILQATNTPSEWGQGGEGYARRFANDYGQHILRQTIIYGAADLLHEDNRYFPSGQTGAMPRLKYAVESTFLARKDDGTRRLSYSRIGGVIAVAFISREWQPRSTRGAEHAGASAGTVLASEAGFNIAREFLPKVFHSH